jgi:hypothetical protein
VTVPTVDEDLRHRLTNLAPGSDPHDSTWALHRPSHVKAVVVVTAVVILVDLPLEHVRQASAARRREDVTLVVEAHLEHLAVVAEVDRDTAGADDVDVAELHSLVELEVAEHAEENLQEPIHHASRYRARQENKSSSDDGTLIVVKHPTQPLDLDEHGTLRFKANAIVRFLLDAGPFDMNKLALMPFSQEDREQFAQLIGYSFGGFGELSYVSDETYEAAEKSIDYRVKAKLDAKHVKE